LARRESNSSHRIRPDSVTNNTGTVKSDEMMLTRWLMTSGSNAVSAMKPPAITKGRTIRSLNLSARTIASTMGVRISTPPSLLRKTKTAAPRRTI